jgi:6-phosphogluconate dehydrogenase (decarboxylating)
MQLGMIGLGRMGSYMVQRLLKAGPNGARKKVRVN